MRRFGDEMVSRYKQGSQKRFSDFERLEATAKGKVARLGILYLAVNSDDLGQFTRGIVSQPLR